MFCETDYDELFDVETGTLNLSHRDYRTLSIDVVNTYYYTTKELDLSYNRLSDLNWIYKFIALKVLILDDNRLNESHLKRLISPLHQIKVLMLNKNEFSDLHITVEELQRLFPNLEHLSLHGNAICPDGLDLRPFSSYINYDYSYYRSVILSKFPNLQFLDHASVNNLDINTVPSTRRNVWSFYQTTSLLKKKFDDLVQNLSQTCQINNWRGKLQLNSRNERSITFDHDCLGNDRI